MIGFLLKNKLTIVGLVIGSVAGYMYYQFVGCNSGSCHITSVPLNSTLYGAAMGGLFFSSFGPNKNTNNDNN